MDRRVRVISLVLIIGNLALSAVNGVELRANQKLNDRYKDLIVEWQLLIQRQEQDHDGLYYRGTPLYRFTPYLECGAPGVDPDRDQGGRGGQAGADTAAL